MWVNILFYAPFCPRTSTQGGGKKYEGKVRVLGATLFSP